MHNRLPDSIPCPHGPYKTGARTVRLAGTPAQPPVPGACGMLDDLTPQPTKVNA
ncbi:hypothetical protein [Dissulfurimicrobium sp.]|uniref:hypothetical protein n=1 Tax=Dissulfurimicrobium sp. TaxID=2022436 RepID=UPI003D0AF4E7